MNNEITFPITPANYFQVAKAANLESKGPGSLKEIHASLPGWLKSNSWEELMGDGIIGDTLKSYFQSLEKWIKSIKKTKPANDKPAAAQRPSGKTKAKAKSAPKPEKETSTPPAKSFSEKLPPALRFIKRYFRLDGKLLTKRSLVLFIEALQKAIVEKTIHKASLYGDEILDIQEQLVKSYNDTYQGLSDQEGITIEIQSSTKAKLSNILGSHAVLPSIKYLKRFVGLVSKPLRLTSLQRLQKEMINAISRGKIAITGKEKDPYAQQLKEVMSSLAKTISSQTLTLSDAALNGIQSALAGYNCQPRGLGAVLTRRYDPKAIIATTDFEISGIETLGLPDHYKTLFGDLIKGFSMLVWGPRGSGKSTLLLYFANWLARHQGTVLYVSFEEGFAPTSYLRLENLGLRHPDLFWTGEVPEDLSRFDFIVIDSITHGQLGHDTLKYLKLQYPTKSFIYVAQATTQGEARGGTLVPHLVDVEIIVKDKTATTFKSRFGAGGSLKIRMPETG